MQWCINDYDVAMSMIGWDPNEPAAAHYSDAWRGVAWRCGVAGGGGETLFEGGLEGCERGTSRCGHRP